MTDAEQARLFVALELPAEVRGALERWRDGVVSELSGLRPLAPESLHVTLCFLGSLPISNIAPIVQACGGAAGRVELELSLGAPVWLPTRRPGVLAVTVADRSGALANVQARVSAALLAGGWYRPEPRPFLAHVTVARVRRGARVRPVELAALPAVQFTGSAVTLFRSRPGPCGSVYESLSRRPA